MTNVSLLRILNNTFFKVMVILLLPFKFLFSKKINNNKVLLIRLWGLGDCVNTLPLIKHLSNNGFKVDVLTTQGTAFVFKQSYIKKVKLLPYNKPWKMFSFLRELQGYEVTIDTEQFLSVSALLSLLSRAKKRIGYSHLLRSFLYTKRVEYVENHHFVENFLELAKPLKVKAKLPLKLEALEYSVKAKKRVDTILSKYRRKKLVVIHMGTGATALGRRWPVKKFSSLVNKLSKYNKNVQVLFTGVPNENNLYQKIEENLKSVSHENLIGKLSLDEFIYLLSKIKCFIGNDSGPMHLSAAMGTRTIGLFGMNSPQKVGAWPLNKNSNIYKNPQNNPIINNKYSKYPKDENSTINLIKVNDVYREAITFLKK